MPTIMLRKTPTDAEEETRTFLISLPVFDNFNVTELSNLARYMSYIHLQQGEYLFTEGDLGTFMGFVVTGVLEVYKQTETGEDIILARLARGSSIGEMAIMDKAPRSATVIAKQPTTLLTLTEQNFDVLAKKHPETGIKVIRKIARLLSLNMRRTSSRLADLLHSPP